MALNDNASPSSMKNPLLRDRLPHDQHDADQAAKALARELEKLSFREREQILHEIHGVDDADSSSPRNDEAQQLSALERALARLVADDQATAYARARRLDRAWVENEAWRKLFLRASEWDANKAAQRLALHFQVKQELFVGDDDSNEAILVRDVTWNDLDEEERRIAESGVFQLGSQQDVAGRVVLFAASALLQPQWEPIKVCRAFWYIHMTALRTDVALQTKGAVAVFFYLQQQQQQQGLACNPTNTIPSHNTVRQIVRTRSSLPFVTVAMHFCYDSPALYLAVVGFRLVMFAANARQSFGVRFHYGSTNETLRQELQSFGIRVDNCPFLVVPTTTRRHQNNNNNDDNSNNKTTSAPCHVASSHRQWLVAMRELEEEDRPNTTNTKTTLEKLRSDDDNNKNGTKNHDGPKSLLVVHEAPPPADSTANDSSSGDSTAIVPQPADVLFGRTKRAREHVGNVRCHELVRQHSEAYEQASRRDKPAVIDRVVALVHAAGGRFLRWERSSTTSTTNLNNGGDGGAWVVVDDKKALSKVGHMFRDMRDADGLNTWQAQAFLDTPRGESPPEIANGDNTNTAAAATMTTAVPGEMDQHEKIFSDTKASATAVKKKTARWSSTALELVSEPRRKQPRTLF